MDYDLLVVEGDIIMGELFRLTRTQLSKIEPYFPVSRGVPRVDDLRVISGIIHVLKRGLQWQDAPKECSPYKTLYTHIYPLESHGHMERTMARFDKFSPEFSHRRRFGIITGIITAVDIPKEMAEYVLRQGFYVAGIWDELFAPRSPEEFVPHYCGGNE
uniref:Transposase of IS4/5 family (DUF4096) n=1 Tax=Candidatus Kentrum sp. FW TaxID=2126338 RepID=A0A450SJ84_9GAMM|nr:MAG: Putative transposase of IS4/5 family (DUF4096) [Candidatus Kentron sp. FW]VFJ53504.1 MAG: Putative transposase of IS4/5 family (DUF4096) [Candidatus Kentron sp. FW]